MSDVTQILGAIERGDAQAAAELLPVVYDELRRLASRRLAQERPGQTLQATALVHEAYLRLVGPEGANSVWTGRNHFFAAAAEAMRRILIESARRKHTDKRGGGMQAVSLEGLALAETADGATPEDLLSLDEALTHFAEEDPVKAELVKLRFFAGLSIEEAAAVLGISRATAARYWDFARSWLFAEMSGRQRETD
jgi:RNA polymerase sigma factor (TIGR02999 family)